MLVELKYLETGINKPSIYLPFIAANSYNIQTIGRQMSHDDDGKPQRLLEYEILVFHAVHACFLPLL